MPNIPYKLMKNPTQAELLAMIEVSIQTLKGYDFMIASQPMTDDFCSDLKEVLPPILLPLFGHSLTNRSDFDGWVGIAQRRLNLINGLPELHDLGDSI